MGAIRGTYIDGKIVLNTPPDWLEGTEVNVTPAHEYVGIGMREEDWPTTPEGIAALIEKIERLEPFLTPEEYAAWEKRRAEDKAFQLSQWEKWTKEIGDLFK
jgi:hypothetical protein